MRAGHEDVGRSSVGQCVFYFRRSVGAPSRPVVMGMLMRSCAWSMPWVAKTLCVGTCAACWHMCSVNAHKLPAPFLGYSAWQDGGAIGPSECQGRCSCVVTLLRIHTWQVHKRVASTDEHAIEHDYACWLHKECVHANHVQPDRRLRVFVTCAPAAIRLTRRPTFHAPHKQQPAQSC